MSDHLFQQLLVHNSKFSFSVKSLRFEDHPLDKLLDILYNSKYNPHHHPQSKENIPPPPSQISEYDPIRLCTVRARNF